MYSKKSEIKIIYLLSTIFFIGFLIIPLTILLLNSFKTGETYGFSNYILSIKDKDVLISMINSIKVSALTSIITTFIAFILSYTIHCTNIYKSIKNIIKIGILVPMLLPTITYGFAIIYSFGKQGLLTRLFGREIVQIYGFKGLLIGYIIYTLPPTFLIINNSFTYIDKKFIIVSKLMGDGKLRSFVNTIVKPLIGTLCGALVLSFVLSFTDFGIPASIGGNYKVISAKLYQVMLGAIPDFNMGSVIAIYMLIPAVFAVIILKYVERFNFHYYKFNKAEIIKNNPRDIFFSIVAMIILLGIISIFLVMFIVPFTENFPYNMNFTLDFFKKTLVSEDILDVYKNSIIVSIFSAVLGSLVSYILAIINVRTGINKKAKTAIDIISMITNTVPGMVLGLSYLLFFNKSSLKGTFIIIILCNVVHFFTTPYLMAKNSFSKMNPNFENTGELLGDSWIKTVVRVILPNSITTIIEMFTYYFINSMVTISAIIFIVNASTSVMTSKIKELEHYSNFNQIFVLSILIFITNILVKISGNVINDKLSIYK